MTRGSRGRHAFHQFGAHYRARAPRFDAALNEAAGLRDSSLAEMVIVLLVAAAFVLKSGAESPDFFSTWQTFAGRKEDHLPGGCPCLFQDYASVLCAPVPAAVPWPSSGVQPEAVPLKRQGLFEYGKLAAEYTRSFDQKWIRESRQDEPILGSSDIQSLADLANRYEIVRKMKLVPFGRETVLALAAAAAFPMFPLLLTVIPLDEIVMKILTALF